MESKSVWPAVIAILVLLVVNLFTLGYAVTGAHKEVAVPSAESIASKIKVPASVEYNDSDVKNQLNKISSEVFKEDLREAKAIELASAQLSDKDFKKALAAFLLDNNASFDDYKDIKSIVVLKNDSSVSGYDATVDYTIKVGYDSYGDNEYAKVKVTFSVSDLKEKDAYVDAEVSGTDFEFVKFYD